jgi:hypothetical protein
MASSKPGLQIMLWLAPRLSDSCPYKAHGVDGTRFDSLGAGSEHVAAAGSR